MSPPTAPRSNYGIFISGFINRRCACHDDRLLRDGQPFAWTEIRNVRIDGEPVVRHRLLIAERHVGLRTPSCGNIQILDVGAELVIDDYGRLLKDAIVRPKKVVPLARDAR